MSGAVGSVPPPPSPSHLGSVGRRQLEPGQESGRPKEAVQGHSRGSRVFLGFKAGTSLSCLGLGVPIVKS